MKTKVVVMVLLPRVYKCATRRSVYTVHVQHNINPAYADHVKSMNIFASPQPSG
jgi:hypothetical protein